MAGAVVQVEADAGMIEAALAALPYVKNPQYRETLKAAGRVYAKGEPPDELNVARQLESANLPPPKDGWHAGLTNPLSDMVTPGQVRQAVTELREMDFEESIGRVLEEPNGDRPLDERLQVLIDAHRAAAPTVNSHAPVQFDAPPPDVLIERDHDGAELHAVLVRGDVSMNTGPGKSGKSTFIAGICRAAKEGGSVFGLNIRKPMKVLLVNLEDIPWSVARNLLHYGSAQDFEHVVELPRPVGKLWESSPNGSQANAANWSVLESAVADFEPDILVIDTVAHAFPGAAPETVAEFVGNLRALAQRHELGVLLVGHCTKSAQRDLLEGKTWLDDSIVAGGAQWVYGPRCTLVLHKVGKKQRHAFHDGAMLLRCHYANIGPSGWGTVLLPRYDHRDRYQGIDPEPHDAFDDIEDMLDSIREDQGPSEANQKNDDAADIMKPVLAALEQPGGHVGAEDLYHEFLRRAGKQAEWITSARFGKLMGTRFPQFPKARDSEHGRHYAGLSIE